MKIAHIADVHWRGLKRHAEYRKVFEQIFAEWREQKVDRIVVVGDIVHTKTQGITPELIDNLTWWFNSMAEIAPTIVTLGNHDGLILNKSRMDAITPLITALDNDRIIYIRNSEVVKDPGFPIAWCNFSCFDEDNWDKIKKVKGKISIALFHGSIRGAKIDSNWELESSEATLDLFKGFDFALLGDIHKQQFLDSKKRVAYCGSTIQQNHAELNDKGYLIWDIEDKNTWSVKHHVIPNPHPFVTVKWNDCLLSTIESCKLQQKGSRFRIATDKALAQEEMKSLGEFLKNDMEAQEIIWKIDSNFASNVIDLGGASIEKASLRDRQTHMSLLHKFISSDDEFSESEWEQIERIIEKHLSKANEKEAVRNSKWSIQNMQWDNVFSYGKGNNINFSKLSGIVGLFGPNRSGKSSIPGTLMYALYNTTDRGSIKNLHIVNARKGNCVASVDFAVNGQRYRSERMTAKTTNRKGITNAATHMNLFRLDNEGNVIEDLSGEQRRDSDKILKELIGTPEDFLLTSFASQGEMNNFIRERATNRKSFLNSFLDLGVFDKMYSTLKDESFGIREFMKNKSIDYDAEIERFKIELSSSASKKKQLSKEIETHRKELTELNIILATHKSSGIITRSDIEQQKQKINDVKQKLKKAKSRLAEAIDEKKSALERISKIENLKEKFPIDDLREQNEIFIQQQNEQSDLQRKIDTELLVLSGYNKSVKKLAEVPCGDQFPTCKFIKDSHKASKLIDSQLELIDSLKSQSRMLKGQLQRFLEMNLDEKLKKYEHFLSEEVGLKNKVASLSREEEILSDSIESNNESLSSLNLELSKMKLDLVDSKEMTEIDTLKSKIKKLEGKVKTCEHDLLTIERSCGSAASKIEHLLEEKTQYESAKTKWKIYNLLLSAYGKNGIPLMVLSSELPKINAEISKILQGVTGFTIVLNSPAGSNSLEILIDYGDSARPIELGSGMEKMMASLALRVALINISALPKSDILIIDEGFGALDDTNVEACNKLLESLKKYFKTIFVISHVDAIKDSVDYMLEITVSGNNSHVFYE